jgi:hypothetical protein
MLRLLLIAGFALLTGMIAPTRAQAQAGGTIKCESWNYQQARCPVPNIVSANLDQVTGGQCQQNRSWGWDRGGIWVSNGCRGRFSYQTAYNGGGGGYYPGGGGGGYPPSGGGVTVRCESWNYQPARCPANTGGGVYLSRRIAGSCEQGQTWGWDRSGIWVAGGCRADFTVGGGGGGGGGYYPGGGGYNPGGQSFEIKCESWNYQPARCPANINGDVRISQAIAGNCVLGRSWGWDRAGIWVNNGCRAKFRING